MPTLQDVFEDVNKGTFDTKELELRYEDIGENKCSEICKKLKGFQIKKLNFSNNKLNDKCIKMLLQTFPDLEEVDVSFNLVGDEGASFFSLNETINDLNVAGNNLSISGAIKLFSKPKLKQLNLMENRLRNIKAIDLESIEANNTLMSLNLVATGITHDVVSLIKIKLRGLIDLNLAYNTIGDEGAVLLSEHPKLASLNLTENNIGDPGAIALARSTTLVSLILFNNNIHNEGLIAFSGNKSLTFLNLSSNKLHGDVLNQFFRINLSLLELVAENNKINSLDYSLLRSGRKVDLIGNPVTGTPVLSGYKRKSDSSSNTSPFERGFESEDEGDYPDEFSSSHSPPSFSSPFS